MEHYGLTEEEKNYYLHEYNHPLFNNMKAFMDSCWEINLCTGTVVMLYETLNSEYTGSQFDYNDILKEYGEHYVYSLEREEWYKTFSVKALSGLKEETSVDIHFMGKTGIPEICRIILTPAADKDGKVQRVYLSSKNIESDVKMLREMQEEKQIIFAAMGVTYPIIIYSNLTRNVYTAYMLSEHKLNIPMAGTYDSLIQKMSQDILPKYRRNYRELYSRKSLEKNLTSDGQYVGIEYEHIIEGVTHWLSSKTVRIDNPCNSDFMAITLTAIIDEQRHNEYVAKVALQDAYNAALDAGKAKSEFLSRMSHEMLTPLNTVQCLASLGLDNLNDPKQTRRILSEIGKAAGQLNAQISRLLDTSLLESEMITLSEAPSELTRELMYSVDQLKEYAADKIIHIDISCDEIIHDSVICDSVRIRQIFSALISNAFKFTNQNGHVSIILKEGSIRRSGFGYYEFTVKDNGIGIKEEFMSRIFEPFERLEDNRISKNPGTGLGLYIVRNISRLLGGNITAKSTYGEGSEFTATFFLKLQNIHNVHGSETEKQNEEKFDFGGKRILVVEDNELNNEIIADLLRDMNFEVDSAYDGKEAIDILLASGEDYYDGILMDIMMPIIDGYQATRIIRGSGREDLKRIPIIAASANSYPGDIEESLRCGMNDHIAKPLEANLLSKRLKYWIGD